MTDQAGALFLFGTAEPPPERRLLRAGALSAVLEEGNLRTVRFGSAEAVRAVSYLARDTSWGTCKALLDDLRIEQSSDSFAVSYRGLCEGPDGRFAYRMTIRGEAAGRLTMEAVGEALTDFATNRTGFVILHPSEASGGALEVTHLDGVRERTAFPPLVSADQPVFDIAGLAHEPASGLLCTIALEGDAFEMEDQRNWADASFKTYIRPLSKPRPYTIAKGARDTQRVVISFKGTPPVAAGGDKAEVALSISPSGRLMPALSLFLDADDIDAALACAASLQGARELILRFDPARGHDAGTLRRAAEVAEVAGAGLAVDAVFEMREPDREAAAMAGALREAGRPLAALLVSPRREFKSRPSGTVPAGEVSTKVVIDALRAAGIDLPIGAGTPSNFTEFNRNPPEGDPDFVFFGVSSIVHAADDLSVAETVGVYPSILESAGALCPGRPIWLGPCTIGTRHNPYAGDVVPNPHGVRLPAARFDPRQGALFGAAFMIGVAVQAAEAGVERLILAAPTGPFGLIDQAGRPVPAHAVHRILARASGARHFRVDLGASGLKAVAFCDGPEIRVLLANLSASEVALQVAQPVREAQLLEPQGFRLVQAVGSAFTIGPYRSMLFALDSSSGRG